MAVIHPKWRTPAFSLIGQGIWAAALTLSGRYDQLYTYVIYGMVLSYTLTVIGMFWLRWKRPEIPRPYRCTGYPWLPAIYVLIGTAWTLNTIITRPTEAFWGTAIVLIGVPGYLYWKRSNRKAAMIVKTFLLRAPGVIPLVPACATDAGHAIADPTQLDQPNGSFAVSIAASGRSQSSAAGDGLSRPVLFYVITGISLRWIATAAAAGPSSIVDMGRAPGCVSTRRWRFRCWSFPRAIPTKAGFTSGASARSATSPASWRRGLTGPATCPTSLPCSISPPATCSSCGRRTWQHLSGNATFYIVFSLLTLECGDADEYGRARRRQVAAQRGRDGHVDSGGHRDRDGIGGVASLRVGDVFHAAVHDSEHASQRPYFLVGADVCVRRVRNRVVHGRRNQERAPHDSARAALGRGHGDDLLHPGNRLRAAGAAFDAK